MTALGKINKLITKATLRIAIALPSVLLVSHSARAITFETIADSSTSIPGGVGNFSFDQLSGSGSFPALSDGNVVFLGYGSSRQEGIYANFGGGLQVIADTNTTIPGKSGKFGGFLRPSIDGTNVTFEGGGGIYAKIGNNLETVAKTSAPVPGETGTFFSALQTPQISGTNVVFSGDYYTPTPTDIQFGVFANFGKGVEVVGDRNTIVPGLSTTFVRTGGQLINGSNVAFGGEYYQNGIFQFGIFANVGNGLELVADTNTPIPGESGKFTSVETAAFIDSNHVAFFGYEDTSGGIFQEKPKGIYVNLGNGLETLADFDTLVYQKIAPSEFLQRSYIGTSISGSNVLISLRLGDSPNLNSNYGDGIFLASGNNTLRQLIASGDTLDGKTVSSVRIGSQALDSSEVAFLATFTDGSSGIFVANDIFDAPIVSQIDIPPINLGTGVPEPSDNIFEALPVLSLGGLLIKKKLAYKKRLR